MARIPLVTREAIPESDKAAYDAFMESRGGRPNVGPYSLVAHMPEMAQRLESLRTYIRAEESLPQKLQELVMITVAREMGHGGMALVRGFLRTCRGQQLSRSHEQLGQKASGSAVHSRLNRRTSSF